jgi:9-cis-epoxycarotenoid dioxygenase
LGNSTTKII